MTDCTPQFDDERDSAAAVSADAVADMEASTSSNSPVKPADVTDAANAANAQDHARETVIDGDWSDPQAAAAAQRIKFLRHSIDNIDMAMIALLSERFRCTAKVGVLKARAGFAPADYEREEHQMHRTQQLAQESGLDPQIAERFREFVVTESKARHQRIADAGGDAGEAGVLDMLA